jgi:hypothetical protein
VDVLSEIVDGLKDVGSGFEVMWQSLNPNLRLGHIISRLWNSFEIIW